MKKAILSILALSTVAMANVNGEVSAKFKTLTNNFNYPVLGIELEGNVKPHDNILIDGKFNLVGDIETNISNSNSVFPGSQYPEDFKLSNEKNIIALELKKDKVYLHQDTFIRITGLTNGYGSVSLTQHGIDATSIEYQSPKLNVSNFTLSGNVKYTLDYNEDDKVVKGEQNQQDDYVKVRNIENRGDIEANLSYKINDELKVKVETGLGLGNIYADIQLRTIKALEDKLAIDPKFNVGLEYISNSGLSSNVKFGFDKGINLDGDVAYKLDKNILNVDGLVVTPSLKVAASHLILKSPSNDLANLAITPKVNVEYNVYEGLSITGEAKVFTNTLLKQRSTTSNKGKQNMQVAQQNDEKVEARGPEHLKVKFDTVTPSISIGLKYKF